MQVKKFEAPTIQEALETIKRELGPEAIILQTKKNKRGFGLMSKESVEVTAAVSERSMHKKEFVEKRLPERTRNQVKGLPASRQAEFIDKYAEKHTAKRKESTSAPIDILLKGKSRDQVQVSERAAESRSQIKNPPVARPAPSRYTHAPQQTQNMEAQPANSKRSSPSKRLTSTRYVDIDQHEVLARHAEQDRQQNPKLYSDEVINDAALSQLAHQTATKMTMEEELRHLKRMIEEVKITQDNQIPGSASGSSK